MIRHWHNLTNSRVQYMKVRSYRMLRLCFTHGKEKWEDHILKQPSTVGLGDFWTMASTGVPAPKQALAKHMLMQSEERLSQWIESFRKDAECTFGILIG